MSNMSGYTKNFCWGGGHYFLKMEQRDLTVRFDKKVSGEIRPVVNKKR